MHHRITPVLWSMMCLSVVLTLTACSTPPLNTPASLSIGPPTVTPVGAVPIEPAVQPTSAPIESAPSDAATPITVKLSLSHVPRLNETAYLTFTISSVLDAPGTTAEISLPAGAESVAGTLRWSGDLAANQPHVMTSAVKFAIEGDQKLQGKALRPAGNGDVWGDAAQIYLHVTAEAGYKGYATEAPSQGEQEQPTPPAVSPATK